MQPQGHVQVLLNMVLKGMTPQSALDAPRFCISASVSNTVDKEDYAPNAVSAETFLEDGIAPEVRDELIKMGHGVEILKGWARGMFGKGQVRTCPRRSVSSLRAHAFRGADYSKTSRRCLGWRK